MSASRTAYLASRRENREVSSDEYDSDEERYQRKRQRLLKKVAERAAAIKEINDLTRPFFTGSWRLEREEEQERQQKLLDEQRAKENSLANSPAPSKENQSSALIKASDSWGEKNGDNNTNKMSTSSPLKHTSSNGVPSVMEMEETPTWIPLRKSKARHSLALFCAEKKLRTSADQDDDPSTSCQPLSDGLDLYPLKTLEETRSPLRTVVTSNQSLESKKSISTVVEPTSTASSSEDIATPARCNIDNDDGLHTPSSTMTEFKFETPVKRAVKAFKSPVRISPILLQAFGEERARIRGSIGSPDKVVNLEECTSPKDPSKVLKGVVAYVEVRRGEDDRTAGFQWKLKELGATVSETINKKVTHVVFQEGLLSTFRKAKQIRAHIVSTHWVMACDESYTKVQESRYPIEKLSQYELADPLQKTIKRPKIMSPDLGSGRDNKVLMKRIQRQSIKLNSPLTQSPSFTIPVIKTPSPVKSRFKLRKSILSSPSFKDAAGEDSVDDYDGFLAMVEAQVRKKAELKRKSGEMNGPPLDFETRLQILLGRDTENPQDKQNNPPLASIFIKNIASVATTGQVKKSPKKGKISKPSLPPGGSSSIMKNWLQRCSPAANQHGEISSVSAAAAASAAADKILDSMFKGSINEMFSKVTKKSKFDEADTNKSASETETVTRLRANTKMDKKRGEDVQEKPSVCTSMVENSKSNTSNVVTKVTKNKKSDFQGKEACSSAMRSWLMKVKSPSKSAKPTLIGSSVVTSPSSKQGENKRKRIASPLKKVACRSFTNTSDAVKPSKRLSKQMPPTKKVQSSSEDDKVSSLSTSPNHVKFSQNLLGERTPQKKKFDNSCLSPKSPSLPSLGSINVLLKSSPKRNGSDFKSKEMKAEGTPRRRSLRLTPIKVRSPLNNFNELETLEEECKETCCL